MQLDDITLDMFQHLKPSETLNIFLNGDVDVQGLVEELGLSYDESLLTPTKAYNGMTYRVYYGNYYQPLERVKLGFIKPDYVAINPNLMDVAITTKRRDNINKVYEKKIRLNLLMNKI